jgi:hypothetical protein
MHTYTHIYIGSSHGVYALYGGLVAQIILNYDTLPPLLGGIIVCAVLIQILSDAFTLLFFFNQDVGYSAHAGGWVMGILVGLAISKTGTKTCTATGTAVTGTEVTGITRVTGVARVTGVVKKYWKKCVSFASALIVLGLLYYMLNR